MLISRSIYTNAIKIAILHTYEYNGILSFINIGDFNSLKIVCYP